MQEIEGHDSGPGARLLYGNCLTLRNPDDTRGPVYMSGVAGRGLVAVSDVRGEITPGCAIDARDTVPPTR
jgi:hypothetical protein